MVVVEQNLGKAFDRSNLSHACALSARAVLAEKAKISVTGLVSIPAVVFFPNKTAIVANSDVAKFTFTYSVNEYYIVIREQLLLFMRKNKRLFVGFM